jgi:beta-lactamase superfamily II metal-dependent hydrolase
MTGRTSDAFLSLLASGIILAGCAAQSPPSETTGPAANAASVLMAQSSVTSAQLAADAGNSAVTFLSIGTGLCTLISCPNGAKVLNDCGSKTTGLDAGLIASADILFKQLVGSNDPLFVIVSHSDEDHFNLIQRFVGTHSVEAVILGPIANDYPWDFDTWVRHGLLRRDGRPTLVIDDLATRYHDPVTTPYRNVSCGTPPDGIYILTANAGTAKNDRSIVSKFVHGTFSVTFMGDAEVQSEISARENYPGADASFLYTDVLSSAHHGSVTHGANSPSWAMTVRPMATVFSAGTAYENYGHPRCLAATTYLHAPLQRILQGLVSHNFTCYEWANVFHTTPETHGLYNLRDAGAVAISSDGSTWTMATCAMNRAPCVATRVP